MLFWTFTTQTTMFCMLSWIGACQHGVVFARSFGNFGGGRAMPGSAMILPFPGTMSTRAAPMARMDGSATVIPLPRRPFSANRPTHANV